MESANASISAEGDEMEEVHHSLFDSGRRLEQSTCRVQIGLTE